MPGLRSGIVSDLRFAVRGLVRQPLAAAVAIATLSLGLHLLCRRAVRAREQENDAQRRPAVPEPAGHCVSRPWLPGVPMVTPPAGS